MLKFSVDFERRKGKPFTDDSWDKGNIKALLDAHFACSRPHRSVVLGDVETMLAEGYAKITADREKADKKLTPRKLLPVEIRLITEWYDAKMEVLKGEMGAEQFEREGDDRVARRAQTDEIAAEVEAVGEGLQSRHDRHDRK